jgi:DNA polymerase-1
MPFDNIVFDTEANGFLETVDTFHCLWLLDLETGEELDFADQPGFRPIAEGIDILARAKTLWAHNGIKYDYPLVRKFFPDWAPQGRLLDSLVMSRVIWPELAEIDAGRRKKLGARFLLPPGLTGSHSLEAWGFRMGVFKDLYEGGFEAWTPEMHAYCGQDIRATAALVRRILEKDVPDQVCQIEHDFAGVMAKQERHGFRFDEAGAQALYAELVKRRLEIAKELKAAFPPRWVSLGEGVHKRSQRRWVASSVGSTVRGPDRVRGYYEENTQGDTFTRIAWQEFNPSSRQMIAVRLKELGWEPLEFTPSGQPKIDETILEGLPYPQAKVLAEHFLVEKRIGQVAEGDQAWLRLVRNGRIHGAVNPNGAVTGRCTHSRPNVAQVPTVMKPYGAQCRALFLASTAMLLVGADLSGLELRALAHFMARYDGGAYAKVILEGDIHWENSKALGLVAQDEVRDKENPKHKWARDEVAKRFIYAFLYGAGDVKLGSLIEPLADEATQKRVGKRLKAQFLRSLPALKRLIEDVKASAGKGYIKGIDGRRLHIRSDHAALNTLLQSAGALICKVATIFADLELSTRGYVFGVDYANVAHIHDELQLEAKEGLADEVGQVVVAAMQRAGQHFNFRVPIDGEYKLGRNWADTH